MAKIKSQNKSKNLKKKESVNPFEVHINHTKFKIIGQKSKDDRGLPGISRAKAFKKREKTLLLEYRNRHKISKFMDKRIGEDNPHLDPERKMLLRLVAEKKKQVSEKSEHMLNDNEELLHGGKSLSEDVMKDKSAFSGDDEDDEDLLDARFVKDQHFGGDIFTKPKEGKDGKKSRKDWIDEMIVESKKKKAENKMEKGIHQDTVTELDSKFSNFMSIMRKHIMTDDDKEKSKKTCEYREYDTLVKKILFDRSGKAMPADRLKTPEEIAKEEEQRLQKLEEERQKRMLGHVDTSCKSQKSADALDDEWVLDVREPPPVSEENLEVTKSRLKTKTKVKICEEKENIRHSEGSESNESDESCSDEEDEEEADESEEEKMIEENEDEEEADESEEEEIIEGCEDEEEADKNEEEMIEGSDNKEREIEIINLDDSEKEGVDEEDEESSENEIEDNDDLEVEVIEENSDDEDDCVIEDEDDELEASDEDERIKENEDEEDEEELESQCEGMEEEEDNKQNHSPNKAERTPMISILEKKEIKSKDKLKHVNGKLKTSEEMEELPYTFKVPTEYDGFWELLESRTPDDVSTIIERMIACNHPSLGADNKTKANTIFTYILQTLHSICSVDPDIIRNDTHSLSYINAMIPHLYTLTQLNPNDCAASLAEVIDEKYEEFTSRKPRRYPNIDTFIFLKISGLLFPASDFHHDVMTRVLTFLTQILKEAKVDCGRDVVCLLFTSALLLEYLKRPRRFVGELTNALNGILYISIPNSDLDENLPVNPPFKNYGPTSELLVLGKKCRSCEDLPKLTLSSINEEIHLTDSLKCRILSETISSMCKLCSIWTNLSSVRAVFYSTKKLLERIPLKNYPKSVNSSVQILMTAISDLPKQIPHLKKEETVVKTLKMLEPAIEEVSEGMRKRSDNKEYREKEKLLHRLRRERKGAKREIKRDAQFLARQQLKEVLESDAERKRKVNLIMQSLSTQESEYKKFKNKK